MAGGRKSFINDKCRSSGKPRCFGGGACVCAMIVGWALIASRLDRLAFGHVGDARSVGDGVSELRIHHGPGYRVYFARRGDTVILLLCGGDKGSQRKDIGMAKQLLAEWRE